jgi:hypothetical protein
MNHNLPAGISADRAGMLHVAAHANRMADMGLMSKGQVADVQRYLIRQGLRTLEDGEFDPGGIVRGRWLAGATVRMMAWLSVGSGMNLSTPWCTRLDAWRGLAFARTGRRGTGLRRISVSFPRALARSALSRV